MSSLGVAIRVLMDLDLTRRNGSRDIIAIAILSELMGLLIASIMLEVIREFGQASYITLLIKPMGFFTLSILMDLCIIPKVIKFFEETFKVREASFASFVSLILIFSYLAS